MKKLAKNVTIIVKCFSVLYVAVVYFVYWIVEKKVMDTESVNGLIKTGLFFVAVFGTIDINKTIEKFIGEKKNDDKKDTDNN